MRRANRDPSSTEDSSTEYIQYILTDPIRYRCLKCTSFVFIYFLVCLLFFFFIIAFSQRNGSRDLEINGVNSLCFPVSLLLTACQLRSLGTRLVAVVVLTNASANVPNICLRYSKVRSLHIYHHIYYFTNKCQDMTIIIVKMFRSI